MAPRLKRDALVAFIDIGDRAQTPVFVGREDIMNGILRLAGHIIRHDSQTSDDWPAQGKMRLIQGAPGIGKTALLNNLRARCQTQVDRQNNHPCILPVMIPEAKVLSQDYMVACMKEAIDAMNKAGPNPFVRGIMQRFVNLASRVQGAQITGPAGIGAGVNLKPSDARTVPPANCVILLMIDEVQTVPPATGGLLQYLEAGSHGLPILPVLAGLGNSWKALQDVGLSRLSDNAIIQPPTLSPTEVQQALVDFVEHFGITATDDTQELWGGALWQWSRGWPKHLQNALKIMGHRLLNASGDLNSLHPHDSQADIINIRHAYYRQRLGPWTGHAALIGQVMARLGRDPIPEDHIETILHEAGFVAERIPVRSAAMTSMLKLGLLDEVQAGSGRFACPIPSLRSFAVAKTGTDLHEAALTGTKRRVMTLLPHIRPDTRDAWGRTPLHLASQANWPDIVDVLLEVGHDPEARDRWGRTPLHVAAGNTAEHASHSLLTSGASIEAIDSDGRTPLHHAARTGAARMVQFLLAHGGATNALSQNEHTPLHDAAQGNAPACVQRLLEAGAPIQAQDADGQSPLHWAAQADAREAVQTLLAAGADPDSRDNKNRTPEAVAPATGSVCRLLAPPMPPDTEPDTETAGVGTPDGPK